MFVSVVLLVAALDVTASQGMLRDRPAPHRAATLLAEAGDPIRALEQRALQAKLAELRATPAPDPGVGLGLLIGGVAGIAVGLASFVWGLTALGAVVTTGMAGVSFAALFLVAAVMGVAGIVVMVAGLVRLAAVRRETRALEEELKAVERQLFAPTGLRPARGLVLATFG